MEQVATSKQERSFPLIYNLFVRGMLLFGCSFLGGNENHKLLDDVIDNMLNLRSQNLLHDCFTTSRFSLQGADSTSSTIIYILTWTVMHGGATLYSRRWRT